MIPRSITLDHLDSEDVYMKNIQYILIPSLELIAIDLNNISISLEPYDIAKNQTQTNDLPRDFKDRTYLEYYKGGLDIYRTVKKLYTLCTTGTYQEIKEFLLTIDTKYFLIIHLNTPA